MFKYTIDSKVKYTNQEGDELLDLTSSIFIVQAQNNTLYSMYKVPKDMEMRPDKVSLASYGTDEYTEMILKYMLQDNPFAVETGDIVLVPTATSMYNDVIDITFGDEGDMTTFDFVKNYHKYIDESKLPAFNGSQSSKVSPSKNTSAFNDIARQSSGSSSSGQGSADIVGQETSASSGYSGYNNLYNVYGSGSDDVNTYTSTSVLDSSNMSSIDYSGSSLLAGSATGGVGAIYSAGTSGSGMAGSGNANLGYGFDDDDIFGITDLNESNESDEGADIEANLTNNGESGIKFVNGRIYFGNNVYSNPNDISDVRGSDKVNSDLVDCARNGVTLGQFLDATIRNNVKKGGR